MSKYQIKNSESYYVQGKKMDQGGFSSIYECEEVDILGNIIKENLVIKKLHDTIHSGEQPHRFTREMRYLEQLNHTNILKPVYCDYDEEFIVMKKYPMNLKTYIEQVKPSEEETLNIFDQILSAVTYYISEGMLHRDLKPQNILITDEAKVKITDFGLSSRIQKTETQYLLTQTGVAAGSDFYSSPEQLRDLSSTDVRSEIYSLGKIFYSMLTRETEPYSMNKLDTISPNFRHLIKNATKDSPEERFQTIEDFMKRYSLLRDNKDEINTNIEIKKLTELIMKISIDANDEANLAKIFAIITSDDFIKADDLLVLLDAKTHQFLQSVDSFSYNKFIEKSSKTISESHYIFSYVDDIVKSIIGILKELRDYLDLEYQTLLICSAVNVSVSHNRFWSMNKVGEYLSNIDNLTLLEILKEEIEKNNLMPNFIRLNNHTSSKKLINLITN